MTPKANDAKLIDIGVFFVSDDIARLSLRAVAGGNSR
jgi:hypothetical protein